MGIAYAMELPDPRKLFEGTSKLHCDVKLKGKADFGEPGVDKPIKFLWFSTSTKVSTTPH